MLFTFYLLICTLGIERLGRSPVFFKIRRNKGLVTVSSGLVIITFFFSSLNRALVKGVLTDIDIFFFITRAFALGFIAVSLGTLFMSVLQTTQTIEMAAGRGPTVSILTFLTFRSIPLVTYHLNNVIDSQRARGLEMEKIGPRSLIRSVMAIFIPLLILLTGSIDRTSKVLEARGINPRVENKTSFLKPRFRKFDYFLLFYITIQLLISIWIAFHFPSTLPTTTLSYRVFSEWGLIP
jgi:energy-coupling factor transporter transmembrane protein EcfT